MNGASEVRQVGGPQGAPRFPLPPAAIPVVHGPACGPSAPLAPHTHPGLHVGVLFSVDSSNTFYGFLSARPGDALMAESSLGVCRAEAGEKGAGDHSSGWRGRGQGIRQGLSLGACVRRKAPRSSWYPSFWLDFPQPLYEAGGILEGSVSLPWPSAKVEM